MCEYINVGEPGQVGAGVLNVFYSDYFDIH